MVNNKLTTLTKSSDFLRLKENGRRKKLSPWLLVNWNSNDLGYLRVGVTIPKKVGNAVTRNYLRRKIKEVTRALLKEGPIGGLDVNFVFLPQKSDGFFKELSKLEFRTAVESFYFNIGNQLKK